MQNSKLFLKNIKNDLVNNMENNQKHYDTYFIKYKIKISDNREEINDGGLKNYL